MKKLVVVFAFLSLQVNLAQDHPKVENHPSQKMDVVLFTFGLMDVITIGAMSASGELSLNFPKDISFISEAAKENSWSDTAFTLFSKCSNSFDILSDEENGKAVSGGYISLATKEQPYMGLLFMVSDENLIPWVEDSYSNSAIVSSYFEVVYLESDFRYQGDCNSSVSNTEDDTIETLYSYDVDLKAGFNFIEYAIESVKEHKIPSMYEEGVFDTIAKPSKILVTSSQTIPTNTKWIGKFFYN